jgi:hypothetical protein
MIVVSLSTRAPSRAMQDFIDEIRRPRGKELLEGGTDRLQKSATGPHRGRFSFCAGTRYRRRVPYPKHPRGRMNPLIELWYFHVPNSILAAIMYRCGALASAALSAASLQLLLLFP